MGEISNQEHNIGRDIPDNFALFLCFLNCVPGFEISPKMTHPYDPKASCSQGIYNLHPKKYKYHRKKGAFPSVGTKLTS